MIALWILQGFFSILAVAWAEIDPAAKFQGMVYLKNANLQQYMFLDPESTDLEPKAMLWNRANVAPLRGGAWFNLTRGPTEHPDYNLIGGKKLDYVLCASMAHVPGNGLLQYVHAKQLLSLKCEGKCTDNVNTSKTSRALDGGYLHAEDCRWVLSLSDDKNYFFLLNMLYQGYTSAAAEKFNVDPLRRAVFLARGVEAHVEMARWELGRVPAPATKPN